MLSGVQFAVNISKRTAESFKIPGPSIYPPFIGGFSACKKLARKTLLQGTDCQPIAGEETHVFRLSRWLCRWRYQRFSPPIATRRIKPPSAA